MLIQKRGQRLPVYTIKPDDMRPGSLRRERVLRGLCLAAVCLVLTACGGQDPGAEEAEKDGTEAEVSQTVYSLADIPGDAPEGRQEGWNGEPDEAFSLADAAGNSYDMQAFPQETDTGEMLTFERLQELIQEPVPLLEHYAGYQDVGSRVHGYEEGQGHISYPVWDSVSEADLILDIDYRTEGNQIYRMGVSRSNDSFCCVLYNENTGSPGYVSNVSSKLEHYREDVGELFHWIKEYSFPPDIYVMIRPWQFRADMGAGDWKGQTYWWIGEEPEEEKGGDGGQPEWKAALGIMRIPQEYLVFADGVLQEVRPIYGQAGQTIEYEPLEGCGEQAVIWKINTRLYGQTDDREAEDFWYVCLGRENSSWGYIVVMDCRHFSREEATVFVQSIEFQDAAWQ